MPAYFTLYRRNIAVRIVLENFEGPEDLQRQVDEYLAFFTAKPTDEEVVTEEVDSFVVMKTKAPKGSEKNQQFVLNFYAAGPLKFPVARLWPEQADLLPKELSLKARKAIAENKVALGSAPDKDTARELDVLVHLDQPVQVLIQKTDNKSRVVRIESAVKASA